MGSSGGVQPTACAVNAPSPRFQNLLLLPCARFSGAFHAASRPSPRSGAIQSSRWPYRRCRKSGRQPRRSPRSRSSERTGTRACQAERRFRGRRRMRDPNRCQSVMVLEEARQPRPFGADDPSQAHILQASRLIGLGHSDQFRHGGRVERTKTVVPIIVHLLSVNPWPPPAWSPVAPLPAGGQTPVKIWRVRRPIRTSFPAQAVEPAAQSRPPD